MRIPQSLFENLPRTRNVLLLGKHALVLGWIPVDAASLCTLASLQVLAIVAVDRLLDVPGFEDLPRFTLIRGSLCPAMQILEDEAVLHEIQVLHATVHWTVQAGGIEAFREFLVPSSLSVKLLMRRQDKIPKDSVLLDALLQNSRECRLTFRAKSDTSVCKWRKSLRDPVSLQLRLLVFSFRDDDIQELFYRELHRQLSLCPVEPENRVFSTSLYVSAHGLVLVGPHELACRMKDELSLRRCSDTCFPSFRLYKDKLQNVHHGQVNRLPGSSCMSGDVAFFHYRQDGINDEGWGCAYRSLQTLCSWYVIQGHVDAEIPNHEEIQRILRALDEFRSPSFVGSKEWIGSVEAALVLEHLGIPCRIININSVEQLAQVLDVVVSHFKEVGSPIMIGGGVLAFTLLGVSIDPSTGEDRYLILDPHYTGPEDLDRILSKGACRWRLRAQVFAADTFYNLCVPQKPRA